MRTQKSLLLVTFLFTILSSATAQWSDTGNSKTTGSLTIGSSEENSSSFFTILGANQPFYEAGKRDIRFMFSRVSSTIRAYRSSGWASSLDFLTTMTSEELVRRISINYTGGTFFFDKIVRIGVDDASTSIGEGTRMYFGGVALNSDPIYMAKYNVGSNKTDLRISLGDENTGDDRFVIGNTLSGTTEWRNFFVVRNNGDADIYGTLRANKVKIEASSGWADFVFAKDYALPSLESVEQHIEEHGHLSGIPSEKEVLEEGIDIARMQAKLLQKVEELTLYIIEQDKQIKQLQSELKSRD